MDTEDRLEIRHSFDRAQEWKRLGELETERHKVNERIASLRQEIVSLSRRANQIGEEYHKELVKVRPSIVGPKPGEREKHRKAVKKEDKLLAALKDAAKLNPSIAQQIVDKLGL